MTRLGELSSNQNKELKRISKVILLLASIAFLAPHIFYIELSFQVDANYTKFSLVALLWILSHTIGIDFTGPYSITHFSLPTVDTLLLSILTISLNLCLVLMFWRSSKQTAMGIFDLRKVGIILAIQTIIMVGIVSHALNAWLFNLTFPFPLLHLVIVLFVLHFRHEYLEG